MIKKRAGTPKFSTPRNIFLFFRRRKDENFIVEPFILTVEAKSLARHAKRLNDEPKRLTVEAKRVAIEPLRLTREAKRLVVEAKRLNVEPFCLKQVWLMCLDDMPVLYGRVNGQA